MDKIDSLVYDNVTEHVNCAHFWYFMVLGINFKNGNNGKRDLKIMRGNISMNLYQVFLI